MHLLEAYGTPRLPLGVKAALAIDDHVRRLTGNEPRVHSFTCDERPILAIAGVIELGLSLRLSPARAGITPSQKARSLKRPLVSCTLPDTQNSSASVHPTDKTKG